MRHFILYKLADGVIVQTCFSSGVADKDLIERWPQTGQGILFTENAVVEPQTWRVLNGTLVERETMTPTISTTIIQADGVDECVISGLPDPCMVALTGAPVEVTGGSITITTSKPGAIKVEVRADPTHKPWETIVNAL